ncbi:MAG: sigma-54 dependent transcriptional regulator [Sandaracinus sp.]
MQAHRVLFIEDDEDIRENVMELLAAEGMEGIPASSGEDGLRLALESPPDLILCDITLPGMDGYAVIRAVSEYPQTEGVPFIFVSARAERSDVRHGMNLGADDYITKPFARSELLDTVRSRLARKNAKRVVNDSGVQTRPRLDPTPAPVALEVASGALVVDRAMRDLYSEAQRVAQGDISVLVLGETGAGKELLAHEVHAASPRAAKPFIAFNCAALSETLLESELFGHEKGSFTGAGQAQPGLLEAAHGGTVFLDEVGDVPLATQVKLLRVLEEKKVMRVGSRNARPVDIRIVSATNRDLEEEVRNGSFRADLYYRLSGVTLSIPPLRDRHAEIVPLAMRFLQAAAKSNGRRRPELTPGAIELLQRYPWPGNVRELRNVMERACLLCGEEKLEPSHLPTRVTETARASAPPPVPIPPGEPASALDATKAALEAEMKRVERQRIIDAIAKCAGNQTQAASLLGISRRTLVSRLSELDLPRPRKRG